MQESTPQRETTASSKATAERAAAGGRGPLIESLRLSCTCNIETAAAALGIGRSTAYAAARDGSLPVLRVRNRLLVPTAKLLAMLGLEAAED